MTTTTVASGQTVNGQTETSGNELDVASGGTANTTTVQSGGTLQIETGGVETNATIQSGGLENDYGSSSGDFDYGVINLGTASGTGTSTATISGATVESGGTLNLNLKGAQATNTTVLSGGALTINGNAAANGTTLQGGTLELISAKADSSNTSGTSASGTLTFATGSASRLQLDVAQTGTNGTTFAQTITGFAAGDVIDVVNISGGTLTETTNGANTNVTISGTGGSETFTFVGAAPAGLTTATDPGTASTTAGGTDIVVCYCTGTLIRTVRDGVIVDVAVEHLAIGDLAVTASGAHRLIRWLGHRQFDCRRHPSPGVVMPVRISAHAFSENRPARDLLVSPGHSLCVDVVGEVLIPAIALVNGTTITQEDVETVTYWHVELDEHEVILAENMPAESYLEMGNRSFFAENGVVALDASPDAPVATHADFCRPFYAEGALVEVVRAQIAARAKKLGWRLEQRGLGDLHLLVDGVRVEPRFRGLAACFTVPAGADAVWLVSGTTVPAEIVAGSADHRALGFCVAAFAINDGFGVARGIVVDDPRLCVGFHEVERDGDAAWRWTAGRARLPTSLWEGLESDAFLRVDLAMPALPRWVAPFHLYEDGTITCLEVDARLSA